MHHIHQAQEFYGKSNLPALLYIEISLRVHFPVVKVYVSCLGTQSKLSILIKSLADIFCASFGIFLKLQVFFCRSWGNNAAWIQRK